MLLLLPFVVNIRRVSALWRTDSRTNYLRYVDDKKKSMRCWTNRSEYAEWVLECKYMVIAHDRRNVSL